MSMICSLLLAASFTAADAPSRPGSRFTAPVPPRPPSPPAARFEDDDEEEDDDELPPRFAEEDRESRDGGPGVHVYRMQRDFGRQEMDVFRRFRDEGELERDLAEGATAKAKGQGKAELQVKGPITLQLRTHGGDLEIAGSDRQVVSATLAGSPGDEVALYQHGDRVEVTFRGRRELRRGKVHIEVPKGCRVEVGSMSGDVTVTRVADARVRTMSGDVRLTGVGKGDVQTISGDVHAEDTSGPLRLHTVSGNGVVSATGSVPQLEFQSASGGLEWSGACGKDCHLAAETVSGDVRLAVDPKSSFELSYSSHSGELRDELSLAVKQTPKRKHGVPSGWIEATYGKGEGVIECDSFSGAVQVKKR